jgi:hypothetical protein
MRVGCLAQPGKLRQVADGFSSGREESLSQRVHELFDGFKEPRAAGIKDLAGFIKRDRPEVG